MVAAAHRRPKPVYRPCRPVLLTIWTAIERITGRCIGYHVDDETAYLVILDCVDCNPRLIDWRDVRQVMQHRWAGQRHIGAEV